MLPDGRRCTQVHRVQNHGLPSWPRPWVTAYGVVERSPVDRVAPRFGRRNGFTDSGVTCAPSGVFHSGGSADLPTGCVPPRRMSKEDGMV